jgi:hypothetical protein
MTLTSEAFASDVFGRQRQKTEYRSGEKMVAMSSWRLEGESQATSQLVIFPRSI